MSIYVGIDVHRKRSQVAVVTEDGKLQLNKNVVNGSEPMLRLIGDLPAGTPVAFEAAFGWGWLVELLEGYGFDPHLVHPLRCKAIASARLKKDGRRRDLGPAATGGPAARGVDRAAEGPPAPRAAAAPGRPGPPRHPAAQPGPRGRRRPWLRPQRQLLDRPGRGWLAELDLPAASREIVADCLAVIDGLAPVIDRIDAELTRREGRPAGQGARTLPGRGVHRAGDGGRDRRHHPVPQRPQAGQLGRADPDRAGSDLEVRHGNISKMVCAGRNGSAASTGRCAMAVAGIRFPPGSS